MIGRGPGPVRFASFVPRRGTNPFVYVLMAAIALGVWYVVERQGSRLTHPAYAQMMRAAQTMRAAMAVLRSEKQELGLLQPLEVDPNRTALIGSEFTAMTTTLGALDAKRTATNPDLAAALVRLISELNLPASARIAIVTSGSLVGANIAAIAAVEAMELEAVLVNSAGASMYGATDPELTWLDILKLLREEGVVEARSVLGVIGGNRAIGAGMDPGGRAAIVESFGRAESPLLEAEPLSELIAAAEAAVLEAGPVDLLINVGGSVVAMGNCPEGARLPSGLSREPFPCSRTAGLMVRFSQAEVPIVHLLNMRFLAAEWGLPYDPIPLPTPGDNRRVYGGSASLSSSH